MADDYQNSLAQKNIQFSTVTQQTVTPGANYSNIEIFLGTTDAVANFVATPPIAGTALALTAGTYSAIVKGTLLEWLTQFFTSNTNSIAYIIIYTETVTIPIDPATVTAIDAQYATYKDLGFFKFMLHTDISAQVELAKQCAADVLLSQFCMGESDAAVLALPDTTSWTAQVVAAGYDVFSVYHVNGHINGAITQVGLSCGVLNSTGTPIANPLDMIGTLTVTPSGTASGTASLTNLGVAIATILEGKNVNYFETIGDGTGRVTLYGGKTAKGVYAASNWFVQYINFTCDILTANYITQPGGVTFVNNETYQAILLTMTNQLTPFETLGRLSNLKITAPSFAKLSKVSGSIVVPNAWTAQWNESVRKVTVQGTLTI